MTGQDAEWEARLLLSVIGEPGDPRLTGLVADLRAVDVLAALRDQAKHRALRESLTERLRSARPADVLAAAMRRGIRFLTPGDPEWPAVLGDLGHGPVLHQRGGVPIGLWVRGRLRLDEAAEGSVAVVGARSASTYGVAVAGEIGATLAGAGRAVVSGGAFGIDQAAHRGALAARGPTVAVLACGVDRAYPLAHAELLDYIADTGLLVSEGAPGCAPTRVRFLARNRLIAALTRGTVVVEAAARSGALNTAHWAAGMNRVLMGVPGPVTSATSQGVHQLMRSREALVVTGGQDVLEEVSPVGTHLAPVPPSPSRPEDVLTPEQRQVLDAVPLLRGAPITSIARTAGLPVATVRAALGTLETAGMAEQAGGRWRLVG